MGAALTAGNQTLTLNEDFGGDVFADSVPVHDTDINIPPGCIFRDCVIGRGG